MTHLPSLISDLALILIVAGTITLIFKLLKQPLVLGYIVAGLIAGPNLSFTPSIANPDSINIWADIGVIFLLFVLGLEFSFKKLMNVGGTAGITAITEVIVMLFVGILVGQLLGWSLTNSIFLGGMLTMSSTTIIIKAFDELGLRSHKFTSVVFGVLVVEDLVAILMMVLVSTLAVTKQFDGEIIIGSVLKLVFFLVLWFVTGIFLIPAFFRKVRKYMNNETLLIVALGLCLGMVVMATSAGFSAALGAFIMGSILAETIEGEHITKLITPVKDLFGAIFFVSVGMLIDPVVLWENIIPVLIISVAAVLGKTFAATSGVLLSGQSLKTSVQAGFSLGQIGEFSFIIAGLGKALGILDGFIYPIIVAVSVLTTFSSPYLIASAEPFYKWLDRNLPVRIKAALDKYSSGSNTINHESDWKKLLKKFTSKVIIQSVLLLAIVLASRLFIRPFVQDYINSTWADLITVGISLLIMSPFLAALVLSRYNSPDLFLSLWSDNKYNRGRLVSLVLFRMFLAIFFVGFLLTHILSISNFIAVIIGFAIIILVILLRSILNQYSRLEMHFHKNYHEREKSMEEKKSPLRRKMAHLQARDIHLSSITVSPDSKLIGKSLKELNFPERYGACVVKLFRGNARINIPNEDLLLYPYDTLTLVGSNAQLKRVNKELEILVEQPESRNEVELLSFTVEQDSPLLHTPIKETRNAFGVIVVNVERNERSFAPKIGDLFEEDDLVWVVGELQNIKKLFKSIENFD